MIPQIQLCRNRCGTSMVEWIRWLALKLLAPLRCGSGSIPMSRSCSLLTEYCWFTLKNNQFIQLWKPTTIYNLVRLNMTLNTNWNHLTLPHRTSPNLTTPQYTSAKITEHHRTSLQLTTPYRTAQSGYVGMSPGSAIPTAFKMAMVICSLDDYFLDLSAYSE